MKDIWHFINNPALEQDDLGSTFKEKTIRLKNCFVFALICIIVYAALLWIADYLLKMVGIDIHLLELKDKENKQFSLTNLSVIQMWIVAAFLAPVWEEIEFRLLLNPKRIYVALSIALYYFLHSRTISFTKEKIISNPNDLIFAALQALFLGWILYTFLSESFLKEIKENKGKIMIWTSIIVFTYVHLHNYGDLTLSILLLSPLLLLYIFSVGWILTYLRIKNGIMWSITFHIIHNCLINSIKGF